MHMATHSSSPSLIFLLLGTLFVVGCAHSTPTTSSQSQHHRSTQGSSPASERALEYPSVSTPVAALEQRPDDVAIIIGIEDYVFLPPVPGARQSAYDWEDFFRQSLGLRTVYTLLDDEANLEDISAAIEESRSDVGSNGRLWFIFIGHGAPGIDGADGLLVGMDARQNLSSLSARSLQRSTLIESLSSSGTDDVVVVLDTCFSGQTPEGAPLIAGAQPVIPTIAPPPSHSGALILSAARSDQLAGPLTGSERPSFSYLLLGALRGWAIDGPGAVSAENAIIYADRQLRHIPSRRQRPHLEGPPDRILVQNASERAPDLGPLLSGRALQEATASTQRRPPTSSSPQQPSPPVAPAPAPSSDRVHLGFGLTLESGNQWRITERSTVGDGIEQWFIVGYGGDLFVQHYEGKGSYYEENVRTLVDSMISGGGILQSSEDNFSIPPHRGHLRTFHIPGSLRGGEDLGIAMFFVRHRGDLWLFTSRYSGQNGLQEFYDAYIQLIAAMRFSN